MNSNQNKLLNRMKRLVYEGKRRFEDREDRNYFEDLLEINISPSQAWEHILSLNPHMYFPDLKPLYNRSNNTLTFKKLINGICVYIKLQLEITNELEEVVCLSFHRDYKRSEEYEMLCV